MLTEKQLIENCHRGIRSSQYELVQRYSPMLMAACRRFIKEDAVAKDVLQETFIRIFTHLKNYEPYGSFENWMRRICVRCALTAIDKTKLKKEIALTDTHTSNKTLEPDVFHYLGYQEICRLVEELPLGYRTVFNLNVIEGFSHKEIAALLNISESASRSQLSRAKRMLQEKIFFIRKNDESIKRTSA